MRHPQTRFTTYAVVACSLAFVWLTAHYVTRYDWSTPPWRSQAYTRYEQEKAGLLTENGRLVEVLQQAEDELAQAKAYQHEHASGTKHGPHPPAAQEKHGAEPEAAPTGFAYVFYATSNAYACSVLVNIYRLQQLKITFPIHMLASSDVSSAYQSAISATGAIIHLERAPPLKDAAAGYYQDCMLKLLAFKMQLLDPSLKRVLAFDSDQLIMRNLDHLFTGLPDVDLAAPRAYWLAKDFLASTFLLISLSERLWKTVKTALDTMAFNKFDMDLINDLLGDQVMMLSGEYVTLNSHWEDWNLPKWYHPLSKLNMTSIEKWNRLVQTGSVLARREEDSSVLEAESDMAGVGGGGKAGLAAKYTAVNESDRSWPTTESSVLPSPEPGTTTTAAEPAQPTVTLSPELSESQSTTIEPSTPPRFPPNHPLTQELYRLQDAAAVIHFTAEGKPWMKLPSAVRAAKRDAHPLLAEQFQMWRDVASEVCPGGVPS